MIKAGPDVGDRVRGVKYTLCGGDEGTIVAFYGPDELFKVEVLWDGDTESTPMHYREIEVL